MVAFLFQQQKALCHFSLLVTPISLRIFSILLQKCRQYCLLGIQCKKGWHNAQIERSYSNVAIYPDSSWAGVLVDADSINTFFELLNAIKNDTIIIIATHDSRALHYCDSIVPLK